MKDFSAESLSHDPVHGYIPFVSDHGLPSGEIAEQEIIDHAWVQRMRHIHQLQTAWWVYPSAEHTRFQHIVGVMHLASRATETLYESLSEVCPDVPSRGYVELLLRLSGLLHDVGHGPFGHFFDEHYLAQYGLTHETLGSKIILEELGDMLRRARRTPNHRLRADEELDPAQVAYLIQRPKGSDQDGKPRWLQFLRSLFAGVYTLDNMDFVLRDAYMTGYSVRSFDLERLLYYTFFGERGLTLHERGLSALVGFMFVRAELFRSVYFHRTVRAIDLTLSDLFRDSKSHIFPGNPLEHLDEYQGLTESSLLVDVARWPKSDRPEIAALGQRWQQLLHRKVRWKMACERSLFFEGTLAEQSTVFSRADIFEQSFREQLPEKLRDLPLRFDLPRHVHRPGTRGPTAGLNFLFNQARNRALPLNDNDLVRRIPLSWRIARVYCETSEHNAQLATALDQLVSPGVIDDPTNM